MSKVTAHGACAAVALGLAGLLTLAWGERSPLESLAPLPGPQQGIGGEEAGATGELQSLPEPGSAPPTQHRTIVALPETKGGVLVVGACLDGGERPVAATVELFVDSACGEVLTERALTDAAGHYRVHVPSASTYVTARVAFNGGVFVGKGRRVPEGVARIELDPIRIERGAALLVQCVDDLGLPVEGAMVQWIGSRGDVARASAFSRGERAARSLGTSDALGTLTVLDVPRGGAHLVVSKSGYLEMLVRVEPTGSERSCEVRLERLLPIRGTAPHDALHGAYRIEVSEDSYASATGGRSVFWRKASHRALGSIEARCGAPFEIDRTSAAWPVLVARDTTGAVLHIATRSASSGHYDEWHDPVETVLDAHLVPPAELETGAPLSAFLSWKMGGTRVHEVVRGVVETGVRVPTGRCFLDCEATVQLFTGSVLLAEADVTLVPGDVAVKSPGGRAPRSALVRVTSGDDGRPTAGAVVVVSGVTAAGNTDLARERTDEEGEALVTYTGSECTVRAEPAQGHAGSPAVSLPDAPSDTIELRLVSNLATLEVEVATRPGFDASLFRVGVCRTTTQGLRTCVLSINAESGATDRARWELAAALCKSGASVRFEGLRAGAYLVYATPLETEASRITLSVADCLAPPSIRSSVDLVARSSSSVRLRGRDEQLAFVRIEVGARGAEAGDVSIRCVPCAIFDEQIVAVHAAEPRFASVVGGYRFSVPIAEDGPYLVHIDGAGDVPSTHLATLRAGHEAVIRRDASITLELELPPGTSYDDVRITVDAISVSEEGLSVPSLRGLPSDLAVADTPRLVLKGLDPFAQYSLSIGAGAVRSSRILTPALDGSDPAGLEVDRKLRVRLQ